MKKFFKSAILDRLSYTGHLILIGENDWVFDRNFWKAGVIFISRSGFVSVVRTNSFIFTHSETIF